MAMKSNASTESYVDRISSTANLRASRFLRTEWLNATPLGHQEKETRTAHLGTRTASGCVVRNAVQGPFQNCSGAASAACELAALSARARAKAPPPVRDAMAA